SIRAGAAGGGRRRSGLLFFPAVEKQPRPVDPRALVLAVAATWAAREAAQHVGVADDPEEEEECLVRRSISCTLPPRAPRRCPASHGVIQVQALPFQAIKIISKSITETVEHCHHAEPATAVR
uniref:Uncharacterized protein n=1 Tax=Aegilops tauschii subsp. strangulata TaxID=200361 RepID=A0A453L667_AEGTS